MKTIPVSTWARVRHRPAGGRNVDGGENRKPRTKKNNEKRVGRGNYDAQQKSLKEEWHGIVVTIAKNTRSIEAKR